jgi:hypothetical protein
MGIYVEAFLILILTLIELRYIIYAASKRFLNLSKLN